MTSTLGRAALLSSTSQPPFDRRTNTSGVIASGSLRDEAAAGLGVIGAKLPHHVGKIFLVDSADPAKVGHPPLGQQVEIGDQPGHRRVVAVGCLGLQRDAFLQAARGDTGRIERLDQRQRLLGFLQRCLAFLGDQAQLRFEIAGLFQLMDDRFRQPADRSADALQLGQQMFRQAGFAAFQPIEVECLVARRIRRRRRRSCRLPAPPRANPCRPG